MTSRRAVSPPILTIASVLLVLASVALIGYAADNGTAGSDEFRSGVEWQTWVTLAGFALATFAAMLVLGLRIVAGRSPAWGLAGTPKRRRTGYLLVAAGFVLLLAVVMVIRADPYPAITGLPVRHMIRRTKGLVLAGYLAVVPWIALVWLAHAQCAQLKHRARALPPDGLPDTPAADRTERQRQVVDEFQAVIDQLRSLWRLITACVAAAASTVIITLVTAGALRAAFLSYAPKRADEFPASVVLLYGGLFAIFLAAIGLPMVVFWRARARDVVDRIYPWRLGEAEAAGRTHLEAVLHLDVALLRNPLTVLSILAPLVTSLLAVFIPQLAAGS